MTEKKRKFFSGRSVEQAVVSAASYYGVEPDELAYREIEKKHGFVRKRRKAVIRVDPENPRRETGPEPAKEETGGPRLERGPREVDGPREEAAAPVEGDDAHRVEEAPEEAAAVEEEPEDEVEPTREAAEEEEDSDAAPTPDWWHGRRVGREEEGREPGRRVSRSEGLTRSGEQTEEGEGRRTPRARRGRPRRTEEARELGRGRRRGRQEAPPEPEPEPIPVRERPAPRAERLPRVEDVELEDAALDALDMLLEFVDVEAEADLFRDGERLEVELYGPDDRVLLEDEGQLLLAIEHLLPRMIRGLYGDAMPVRVDCADFHFEREERLRELAVRTANEVRRRGKPRTLDEMDPAERRIVHLALADDPSVETESVGGGYYKRLKVVPR